MKKSGIVMEIFTNGKAIVLTKDGEFLSVVPHNKVEIGEETTFTLEKERKTSYFLKRNIRWMASVAAILLILFVGVPGYFLGTSDQVAAYVSVDINPSIDLGVSQKGKVVEIQALNQDGQTIVKNLGDRLKNIPLDEATALIVTEAHQQGFLKPNGDILISMTKVGQNAIPEQEWKEKIKQSLDKQKNEIKGVSVTTLTTSVQIRQEAEKNGLSAGKYALYIMAQNKGYAITVDQLKEQSIHEIMQNVPEFRTIMSQKLTTEEIDQEYQNMKNNYKQLKEKQQTEQKESEENSNKNTQYNNKNSNAQQEKKQESQKEVHQDKELGNQHEISKETENHHNSSSQQQKIESMINQNTLEDQYQRIMNQQERESDQTSEKEEKGANQKKKDHEENSD